MYMISFLNFITKNYIITVFKFYEKNMDLDKEIDLVL